MTHVALRDAVGASVSPAADAAAAGVGRRVGRWGTAARLAVGFALVTLALAVWDASWLEVLVGLVALPALATLVRSASPLRLEAAGHLVTLAHVANALRDRDDQIGCPLFAPFDQLDAHARTGARRPAAR
jgi:hypothetical protein